MSRHSFSFLVSLLIHISLLLVVFWLTNSVKPEEKPLEDDSEETVSFDFGQLIANEQLVSQDSTAAGGSSAAEESIAEQSESAGAAQPQEPVQSQKPVQTPTPIAKPTPKPTPKPKPTQKAEPKSKPTQKAEPKSKPAPKPKTTPTPKAEPKPTTGGGQTSNKGTKGSSGGQSSGKGTKGSGGGQSSGKGTKGSGSGKGQANGGGKGNGKGQAAAGGGQAVSKQDLNAYRAGLQRAIDKAAKRNYPNAAKKQKKEGTVKVRFTLTSSGQFTNISVVGSSGNDALDKAAIKALKRLKGYKPPPEGFPRTQNARMRFKLK